MRKETHQVLKGIDRQCVGSCLGLPSPARSSLFSIKPQEIILNVIIHLRMCLHMGDKDSCQTILVSKKSEIYLSN